MTVLNPLMRPPRHGIRAFVARHPAAAMLIAMFAVAWTILIPGILAGMPEELLALGLTLLAQLLPAVLITAAFGGRPAVRELFSRVFRWRVHPIWYLVALLTIPLASLLAVTVLYRSTGAWHALVTDRSVILAYLNALTILPLVNLWEETAWMGMIQARLATSHGPLLAAVITGPLFGLFHLPLRLGQPLGQLVVGIVGAMVLAIGLRIMIAWMYYAGGASILMAAIVHVTFNATNNTQLLSAADPGNSWVKETPWLVIGILGLAIALLTRGRLGAPSHNR